MSSLRLGGSPLKHILWVLTKWQLDTRQLDTRQGILSHLSSCPLEEATDKNKLVPNLWENNKRPEPPEATIGCLECRRRR
mmetsp:Transcript_19545/g.42384  ORF Transcript_19545/g.42384 Transcript_19545/m.42384 type:complete len:80 (-) Transcript_19545:1902-2141(-)